MSRNYLLLSYGCQMNERDSEKYKGIFKENDFIETTDVTKADLVILNTCSVRENADNKVIGFLGNIKSLSKNKRPIIIVAGCISSIKETREDLLRKFSFINYFVAPSGYDDLDKVLKEVSKKINGNSSKKGASENPYKNVVEENPNKEKVVNDNLEKNSNENIQDRQKDNSKNTLNNNLADAEKKSFDESFSSVAEKNFDSISKVDVEKNFDATLKIDAEKNYTNFNESEGVRKYKHKGFINIMTGCDNFCTYCIVPYARGRETSRDVSSILKEAENLIKNGAKEITLLGQNVNSYKGKDELGNVTNFANLLETLLKTKITRLRYMTSNPKDFTDEIITLHKKYKNLMPSIHLPIQSASNKVLTDMNRKYTRENFLNICKKIREFNEDFSISTDFLIGYPTETEEDFLNNLKIIEDINFDFAFTFIYSRRRRTKAYDLKNVSTKEEINKRFQKLTSCLSEKLLERNKKRVGLIYDVLFDEYENNLLKGRSENNILVSVKGAEDLPGDLPENVDKSSVKRFVGQIVKVKITGAKSFYLEGEIV